MEGFTKRTVTTWYLNTIMVLGVNAKPISSEKHGVSSLRTDAEVRRPLALCMQVQDHGV